MKANDYAKMTMADLQSELTKLKAQLFNLRFQLAAGQLTNNSLIASCKKDIARVSTIIRQRELNIAVEPSKKAK
ncbi:MAG: 50S ribosomal protein L29 [Clostridia bacterium]|nr:50S ribosomal protein L29 [Clostridia bacterium]